MSKKYNYGFRCNEKGIDFGLASFMCDVDLYFNTKSVVLTKVLKTDFPTSFLPRDHLSEMIFLLIQLTNINIDFLCYRKHRVFSACPNMCRG